MMSTTLLKRRERNTTGLWFTIALMAALLAPALYSGVQAQQYVSNPNAGSGSNAFPFGSTSSKKIQQIYLPGELKNAYAGNITKLYIRRGNTSATTVSGLKITMFQTTQTNFTGSPANYVTGATTVVSNGTFSSTSGATDTYVDIPLQNFFYYDPNKTLIITVSHTTTSGTVSMGWRTSTAPSGSGYRRIYSANETDVSGNSDNSWYDIGIDMAPASANDIGVFDVNRVCPGSQDIVATIGNYGSDVLTSATINWSWNGVAQTPISWTGSLATGKMAQVTLGTKTISAGSTYNLKVWGSSPNGKTDGYAGNDTLTNSAYRASLTGSFTINPAGSGASNFTSFSAAATALNTVGICAPVYFTAAPGVYKENVQLLNVPGASSTNTITFDGVDSSKVEITYAGTSGVPFTFDISGTNYVTVKNMTITNTAASNAVGMHITGGSDYCKVQNCVISVSNTATSSTVYALGITGGTYTASGLHGNYNHIDNCKISGGYLGVVFYGGSTSSFIVGNKITNSTITDWYYYGCYNYYHQAAQIMNNKILIRAGTTTTNYGIYSYYNHGGFRFEGNEIDSRYMGIYNSSNGTVTSTKNHIVNNMIYGGQPTSSWYGIYVTTGSNLNIYHNTVYHTGASLYCYYHTGTSSNNDVRNNIFSKVNSSAYCAYVVNSSYVTTMDYNDYYSLGGNFVYLGTAYSTLSALQNGVKTQNQNSVDVNPNFSSVTAGNIDLRIDPNLGGPYGTNVGVAEDIDGDLRCAKFPTMGADESTFGKNNTTVKFFLPQYIYPGSPVTVYNIAKQGEPKRHTWYINDVAVSNDINLYTTQLTQTGDKLKLVTEGCNGKDSFIQTITITLPTAVPVVKFIASKNSIIEGQTVKLTDLSTNGPNSWNWEITPDSVYENGMRVSRLNFVSGNLSAPTSEIRFDHAGRYKVCLTTANLLGSGTKLCKDEYIIVDKVLKVSTAGSRTSDSTGYLYDDGGPDGNYTVTTAKKTAVIATCASEAYLAFNYFDVACGADYVRIYDGEDINGTPLHPCKNNFNTVDLVGPGLTGGPYAGTSCGYGCAPASTDVFVSKSGKFYIEFESPYGPSFRGFEARWWTKPTTLTPPAAKFDAPDSICVNKQVFFTNKTQAQGDITYMWDLDGDITTIEDASSTTTTWAYFIPGDYKITMIASSCSGTDTFVKNLHVYTTGKPKPNFSADNYNPAVENVVFFRNETKECINNLKWTIKKQYATTVKNPVVYTNGTSSLSDHPNVIFNDTGCYTVKLLADNDNGIDSTIKTCFIKVKQGYCRPSIASRATDLGISQVIFNTINNSSASGALDYTNYVSTHNTHLDQGTQVELIVKRPTTNNNIAISAWIDWNSDGDFDDAGEEAAATTSFSGKEWKATITVPGNAKTGATVMRISTNYENLPNLACGQNQFGEYEDYRLYIHTDATKPVITLKGSDTVRVEQGYPYTDSGATALDNVDGDITASMTSSNNINTLIPATYYFAYNVKDAAGNVAVEKRRIIIITDDATPPALKVAKPDTTRIPVGGNLVFPQILSADDLVDGDRVPYAIVSQGINVNVVDTYTVQYSVADDMGNTATDSRVVIVYDDIKPVMTLIGDPTVVHEVNTPYTDQDVIISDNYYSVAELRQHLITANNVDITMPGTYTVNYTLTDPSGNGPVTVSRTVIVQDTTKPVVTLNGSDHIVAEVLEAFTDPGAMVSDNYTQMNGWDTAGTFWTTFPDGIPNALGIYTIIYEATDGAGNTASVVRTVEVKDTKAPVITLKGEPYTNTCRWSTYEDEGYTLSDNFYAEKDITVTPEGSFVQKGTDMEGIYNLRFKATDKSGNMAYSGWRAVNVQECISGIAPETALDKAVSIYPNPNNGNFYIQLNMAVQAQGRISITNALGQEVAVVSNGTLTAGTHQVNLAGQPSGIYFVKISAGDQSVTRRIVIGL